MLKECYTYASIKTKSEKMYLMQVKSLLELLLVLANNRKLLYA